MTRPPIVPLALCALCLSAVSAEPARSALEFFRDEWTIKGHESTYAERCDWLPGKGFLSCHAEDRSAAEPAHSMSVFGYSEADGMYTYAGFNGSGTQRSLRGSLERGVWRFHGQRDHAPVRRWQVTITPTATGFVFREEVSESAGPWRIGTDIEYVRRQHASR